MKSDLYLVIAEMLECGDGKLAILKLAEELNEIKDKLKKLEK